MSDIQKLVEFAANGEKKTDELNLVNGFPATLKPARQWFNYLFNSLTVKINEVIDGLSSEVNNRVNADNALQQNINNETQERENAIASVQQQISQEQTWRENADNSLQQSLNNEAKTRSDQDDWLNQRITNEANTEREARILGDNTLSNRVSILENAPDQPAIGFGQTYVDVTGSRSPGTTFYNTSGKPILVCIFLQGSNNNTILNFFVDNQFVFSLANRDASGQSKSCTVIIPNNSSYTCSGAFTTWVELR